MDDDATLGFWWVIPGMLAGMSVPFIHPERPHTPSATLDAFADELPLLWGANVRAIVCLLNRPGAADTYALAGFACLLLPVADGDTPSIDQFGRFLDFVDTQRGRAQAVAIHCEAGIGRTGTMLAGYLIVSGMSPGEAITYVRALRPGAVETLRQSDFLLRLQHLAAQQLPFFSGRRSPRVGTVTISTRQTAPQSLG